MPYLDSSNEDFFFRPSRSGYYTVGEVTYSTLLDQRVFKTNRGPMSLKMAPIAEPSTILLIGTGVLGLFGYAHRRI